MNKLEWRALVEDLLSINIRLSKIEKDLNLLKNYAVRCGYDENYERTSQDIRNTYKSDMKEFGRK